MSADPTAADPFPSEPDPEPSEAGEMVLGG
jgi:hypothetical protein